MVEKKQNKIDRRSFLKTMGAAGIGSVLASANSAADPNAPEEPEFAQLPKRKLGKTGIEIPSLSLGTMFDLVENQIILRKALEWNINYWDTAPVYAGGNSELGIGKFLSKNPQARKKLFIATKASGARGTADLERLLHQSLKRMNTDYIDLYHCFHGLQQPGQLTDQLKGWAESAKKRGLIRFLGFSTHKNMAQCLEAAAQLDWIDVVMTTYNFRVMQSDRLLAAVATCHKAGIGIIAMKTVALTVERGEKLDAGILLEDTEEDKKLFGHFIQRGFTPNQAKIKFVLEDKNISSACVGMPNVTRMASNIAAVLDKTELGQADKDVLKQYAQATCSGYCAGCGHICDSALPDVPYVSDIMRYLMYYNSYGEKDLAKGLFARIPADVRAKLLSTDYSIAQARCPQHLPIARLIAEAVNKLA